MKRDSTFPVLYLAPRFPSYFSSLESHLRFCYDSNLYGNRNKVRYANPAKNRGRFAVQGV